MGASSPNRVIVCGGGLAGLSAAVTVLESGVPVTLFEKAPDPGGNAAMSGGMIWSFTDFDRIRQEVPDGDPVLQWQVHDGIEAASAWLQTQGATLTPVEERPELGRHERRMDPPQAIAALSKRFMQLGGRLLPEHAMESLITADDGVVHGVRVVHEGRIMEERALAVVLATGGLQGNPELLSRYVLRDPDNLILRANPWSTGDAFIAATAIGAAPSAGLDTFYGHSLPAPPAKFSSVDFRDVTQWYSQQSIAVNLLGQRFADESEGNSDQVINQRLAQQPQGRGFYIFDQAIMESPAVRGKVLLTKVIIERSRKVGAMVPVEDSMAALCHSLAVACGVPEKRLLREISEFNRHIETGEADELAPPRRRNRSALLRPPFCAIAVKASITFAMGGLQIDEHARVLRRAAGSSPMAPVPPSRGTVEGDGLTISIDRGYRQTAIEGLYAAGTDVGNICNFGYMGGLGPALVFGRVAGLNAANLVKRKSS